MILDDKVLRLIEIFKDSFFPLLKAGLAFTVPLTLASFALGLALALLTALARISNVRFIEHIGLMNRIFIAGDQYFHGIRC